MSKSAVAERPETAVKLRPVGNQVIVRRSEAESVTRGGIVMPEGSKEKPTKGTVFAVGRGYLQAGIITPLEVEEGDTVYFGRYDGTEIEVEEEKFIVLREDAILAIERPAE